MIKIKSRYGLHCADSGSMVFSRGDYCIFTENGHECLAEVIEATAPSKHDCNHQPLRRVLRKATKEDIEQAGKDQETEEQAFKFCIERVKVRNLKMKLVKVQIDNEEKKMIFYYTAEARVDFRELVKDLAARFRTRIEMRQIGVRDEARLLAGCGVCGRGFCCSTFLDNFAPISIRMAKEQNINLNPAKISGICGRLMCCLSYEVDDNGDKRRNNRKHNSGNNRNNNRK